MTFLTLTFIPLLAATLRVATPLLFAGLGELIAERAGVLNLGIEGTMLLAAFCGFIAADASGSLWIGLILAVVAGMACGALTAFLTVTCARSQHVAGLGVTLFTSALALFLYRVVYGARTVQARIDPFPQISLPIDLGPLNPIFNQYALTYVALALAPLVWWVLQRTHFGLRLRAVGDNPEAADMAGINVARMRYLALMIGGALMGVAGAFLSLAQLGSFSVGIISGRGWIAVALVIFGAWQPMRVLLGALLFGVVQAIQLRLQAEGVTVVPYELLMALPYLVTLAALALAGRLASAPAALLKPYRRE